MTCDVVRKTLKSLLSLIRVECSYYLAVVICDMLLTFLYKQRATTIILNSEEAGVSVTELNARAVRDVKY
jgi:hypothetical protein